MDRLTFKTDLGISIDKNEDCPTMSICCNCDIPPSRCNYFIDAIDKLAKYEDLEEHCIKECGCGLNMVVDKYNEFLEHMHELAEYWELEKQGLLLKLPVAEGSIVYVIDYYFDCKHNYECPLSYDKYKCEEDIRCEHEYKNTLLENLYLIT